ncbi:MAG: group II intron reverse transcriptase/maturase [Deltaproteobacteria bacterium]|nr:group II intron reverse transcriptase/maturase [Deltaproteobacteria bacterium]
MRLSTPKRIRTLHRKLYRKAKSEPGFRFYALYDKVYRADILSHAYALVRSNKGAHGVDGISFEAIEADEGKAVFVEKLQSELRDKRYRTNAVRRVWIPKVDGSKRPLGIPTIKDRVAQQAVKLVMEPIFEADFCETSYGFRPKRTAHDAADAVADALRAGYTNVIDADLSKYFDTIPHAKLMAVVGERIADGALLGLIKQWLKAPVVDEDEDGIKRSSGGRGRRHGTPQGGVISPLFSNLYLHLLDRIWERHDLEGRHRARLVRYADDFVVLCAGEVEPSMLVLCRVLERLELRLNENKTKVVNAWRESFDFLGFSFCIRKGRKGGRHYPHVEPSKRSILRIKARVRQLTKRRLTPIPLPIVVENLNRVIRGWSGYFHYRNSSAAFNRVKWQVEERVRTHLRKRHKIKSRAAGYEQFPSHMLYHRCGLFKLPMAAGWTMM